MMVVQPSETNRVIVSNTSISILVEKKLIPLGKSREY